MILEAVIGDLIAEANRCASAHQLHAVLLSHLRRIVPCDTTLYLPEVAAERGFSLDTARRPYATYWAHRALYASELVKAHQAGERLGAYLDTEVYSLAERERSLFFNEIIRPQGIRQRLVTHVQFRGQKLATLQLCRHGRGSSFDAHSLDLIRQLAPVIGLTCAALTPSAALVSAPGKSDGDVERRFAELDARDREIVLYLRRGFQNKEIATVMQVSPHTVRNRLAGIFKKVGVSTRAALASRASRARLH